ncbi:glycosyltransferase [Thiolapillus brandeum]|uniref:Glycosyl transferase family 2 n=1 Tax=Thiolapillus brandeum TaxID=1076588 RepID=A0A7U6GIQ7_9GAMM|nr:glycosyltransferase [Thiolapillus brandeum]BAO44340.1 glycosyl transferase family 2 [Thiolapillus brandeum]
MSSFVSILLPFHNALDTLPACLHSIRKQDHPHWELVAVDDQSTDGSARWLQAQALADHRIRVLANPDKGLVNALNYGLSVCRHELVARMDADDIMHGQRLSRQISHFQHNPDLVLSATQVRLFPEHLIRKGFLEYIRWQNQCCTRSAITNQIYIESPFAHPSVMFKKRPVQQLGGYRQGAFPEDYDLWLRLFHSDHPMEKLPEVLLEWRESLSRVSRTDPRCSREAFDRLRAHYLARDPRFLNHADNFVIWGAGRKTRKRCKHLLEQGFRPNAWVDIDPKKIGNQLQGIPVVNSHWLNTHGHPLVLIYVANHGAREDIARELDGLGYTPGKDYLAVG